VTPIQREIDNDTKRLRRAALVSLAFLALIWSIWLAAELLDTSLTKFGVYPLSARGLTGIILAPLMHGSLAHLVSNSLPTLILGTAFIYAYPRTAMLALPLIYVGSGVGVWLFARENFHIGASGLSHGMMFFLFVIGILRRDRLAMAVAMGVFFLYGSMVWGIFPREPGISYESHFFGALIGVVMAILCRNVDAPPPEKRYRWEDESEDESDGAIGDQWRGMDD